MNRYNLIHRQEGVIRADQAMRGFWDNITGETADELEAVQQKYNRLLYVSIGGALLIAVLAGLHYKSMKDKGQI